MRRIYLALVLLLACPAVWAQPAGWSYARGITITEHSGAALTGYQLKLYFDTQTEISAGRMLATGDDIRFGMDCAGSTLLNYWIEGPMNDDSTLIWVKIPSIPANGIAHILMYYGNPSATSASAVQGTFIGPHSSTDSVATGGAGGVGNSQRGFRFSPNQDVLVASFGKREPTGTTRYVTLFNFATQAILRQMQVSGPAGQYSYGTLASPIWLTTGTQYSLQVFQGASDGYYFGNSSAIGQHLTYYDMKYCNSCTQNTFPTSTLTNYHYGYPDLWYYTRNIVTPAPTYELMPMGMNLYVSGTDAVGCAGDTVILSSTVLGSSGFTNCVWTPAGTLTDDSICNPGAIVAGMMSYGVTVTDSVGCTGVDTAVNVADGTPVVAVSYDTTTICPGDTIGLSASGGDLYTWGPGGSLSGLSGDSVLAFPTVTTTYALQGTDTATGCTATDTFVVNVSDVIVDVVAGQLNMCEGDSLLLQVSGADTYAWSPATGLSSTVGSAVMASPPSDVTYTITGTDTANGCTAEGFIEVLVHPLPTVSFDLPDHYCSTDPATPLTFGTPSGGTYTGTGVAAGMFSPVTAGAGSHVLTYTYTDGFGCEASDTALAIVDVCIGISPGHTVNISVHPNPSTGAFTVTMGAHLEVATYRVVNLMGQVVAEGLLENGSTIVDLQDQPVGLYLLSVEAAAERQSFSLEILR